VYKFQVADVTEQIPHTDISLLPKSPVSVECTQFCEESKALETKMSAEQKVVYSQITQVPTRNHEYYSRMDEQPDSLQVNQVPKMRNPT
jgi:hypothetical protein